MIEKGNGDFYAMLFVLNPNKQKTKVQKQLRHKRMTGITLMDALLSSRCHWYAQPKGSIVPIGNENDSKHQRPDYIHT